ncbi:metallophosphoesterase [Nguyenibacter sp. L1]|uniref:metallophosphoesterase n=1 Tax=Nguyenibacter sp. L1 TaxID=3049350 RepID=UPI002B48C5FA|nr:metallophosphoesterase [Nguyenibacter sp. L1]WRH89565.1 metallophosphoesterase [Nguyenibacter sp. L1]
MTTWFTSDLHFGHKNILKHCNRPFESVKQMDAVLITNWNARVRPTDDIWCLGEFCWKSPERYGARLKGRKHLIVGNHDGVSVQTWDGWTSVQHYAELKLDDRKLVLFHYPIAEWNGFYRDTIHLYGHVHGNRPFTGSSCDVGVDCWNFSPTSLTEILGVIGGKL